MPRPARTVLTERAELTFRLLGPVQAWQSGRELHLGAPQQRSTLAILLIRNGDLVTMDEFVNAVWGTHAPRTAVNTVRTYVCRLRQLLPAGAGFGISSIAGGYRLRTREGSIDTDRLRHHLERARAARHRGDLRSATTHLRAALALPSGSPLAGTAGPYLEQHRRVFEHLIATATEDQLAIAIERGDHQDAIGDLTRAVAADPLRERPRILLMTALYRNGQQADALAQYQEARTLFADELGMEPGEGLRTVHQQILTGNA